MKTLLLTACIFIPLFGCAENNHKLTAQQHNESETVERANPQSPVYLIVQLTIPDSAPYTTQYAIPVVEHLQSIGANIVAISPDPQVLEGKWDHKSTVIIKFPSMSVVKEWYSSEEYKPYIEIRNELTDGGNMVLVPAFDHPSAP
ncbi:MAG: hypothetical protein COA43_03625 [Robiginitomaculum sp.]|nr:MAG: hypothetical protein COA43_03625 [Robiginitomaculum sp.]